MHVSDKALARARDKLRELAASSRQWLPIAELFGRVNACLGCWERYIRHGYPSVPFHKLNGFAMFCLVYHLRRRSQRPDRLPADVSPFAHLQALGWSSFKVTKR